MGVKIRFFKEFVLSIKFVDYHSNLNFKPHLSQIRYIFQLCIKAIQMVYSKLVGFLIILFLGITFNACVNPPDFPDAPEIEFLSISPQSYFQKIAGNPSDTIEIRFFLYGWRWRYWI